MTFPLLEKYGVSLALYRPSSYPKMEAILSFCEVNNLHLERPVFKKKGMSGNAFVCYQCTCGESAESMASGFLQKTVFACKKCNAGLINKKFKPRATADLVALVESKKFKVLSHDHDTKMQGSTWTLQCPQGHAFSRAGAHLLNIKEHSCTTCWNPSVEESWTRLLIEQHFKTPFPNTRPSWLKSPVTHRTLELDMYNEGMMLAFEYHGVQHFKPIFGDARLDKSHRNDAARRQLCRDKGVRLIELMHPPKAYDLPNFLRFMAAQLRKHGIFVEQQTLATVRGTSLLVSGSTKISEQLDAILKKNNMTWVSGTYVNSESSITVRNNCCGKEVVRPVNSIRNMALLQRERCISCLGVNHHHAKKAIARHTSISIAMCMQLGYVFKQLRFNPAGQCSGFSFVGPDGQEAIVGIKKYKQFIESKGLYANTTSPQKVVVSPAIVQVDTYPLV